MENIDDEGKIWLKGSVKPEYGVRVGNLYFITGKEDSETISSFIYQNYLFIDLDNKKKKYRIFRRFSLDLVPKIPGILFNGFEKTKHADIKVVTYCDNRVESFKIDGENYLLGEIILTNPIKLMTLAGWG